MNLFYRFEFHRLKPYRLKPYRPKNSSSSKTARMAFGALLLWAIASCSQVNSQCKQFANVVNQSQGFRDDYASEMDRTLTAISSAQSPEDLGASANDYIAAVNTFTGKLDGTIQQLGDLTMTDDNLNEYRKSYILILTGSQTSLSEAKDAMRLVAEAETADEFRDIFDTFQTKAERAFSDIQSFDAQEAELLEQFNSFCSAAIESANADRKAAASG